MLRQMFGMGIRAATSDTRTPGAGDDYWYGPTGYANPSGMPISPESVMRQSTAYRCCTLIAGSLASVPFVVYRGDYEDGERATDHWLYPLVHDQPNVQQTSWWWRMQFVLHLLLMGKTRQKILWTKRGPAEGFDVLDPRRVRTEYLPNGDRRYIYTRDGGTAETLVQGEVLRIDGPTINGKEGLTPVEYQASTLGIFAAQTDYYGNFLRNDGRPGGLIEYEGTFKNQAEKDAFEDKWRQSTTGSNRGKMRMLMKGMKWVDLAMKHTDAELMDQMKLSRRDVCSVYGVPPYKLGIEDAAPRANVEQLAIEFVQDTLLPWAVAIEQSFKRDVILEDGVYVKLVLDGLMRGDSAARTTYYQRGVSTGWLTINEARAKENLPKVEHGDTPLRPANLVELGSEPPPPTGGANNGGNDPGRDNRPDPSTEPDGDATGAVATLPPLEVAGAVEETAAVLPDPATGYVARAREIVEAAAQRAVNREVGELRKAGAKHANDSKKFRAAAAAFYTEHAEFLTRGRLLAPAQATDYCGRQYNAIAAEGLAALERIGAEHVTQLVELAMEGA